MVFERLQIADASSFIHFSSSKNTFLLKRFHVRVNGSNGVTVLLFF